MRILQLPRGGPRASGNVADAAVTDTHALLFHGAGGKLLGPRAAAHFRAADEGRALVYVPMAVLIEVAFLARAGRGGLRVPPSAWFERLFQNPAYQPFDLTSEQVFAAEELRFNRDPYDALIVSAAHVLGLPLMTRDLAIVESKTVKVLW
jgi:PIN domain nuclease of toxin-antitoxin system